MKKNYKKIFVLTSIIIGIVLLLSIVTIGLLLTLVHTAGPNLSNTGITGWIKNFAYDVKNVEIRGIPKHKQVRRNFFYRELHSLYKNICTDERKEELNEQINLLIVAMNNVNDDWKQGYINTDSADKRFKLVRICYKLNANEISRWRRNNRPEWFFPTCTLLKVMGRNRMHRLRLKRSVASFISDILIDQKVFDLDLFLERYQEE